MKPVSRQLCRKNAVSWSVSAAIWCALVGVRVMADNSSLSAVLLLALALAAAGLNLLCCFLWWRRWFICGKKDPPNTNEKK